MSAWAVALTSPFIYLNLVDFSSEDDVINRIP
jgi:hypothetical protein